MTYKVFVDDNFNYMDESERYELGEFPTLDAAIEVAQQIVDKYLVATYEPGMTSDALFDSYTSFGDDPFVHDAAGNPGEVLFSAWEYAQQRCDELCKPATTAIAKVSKARTSKPKKAKHGPTTEADWSRLTDDLTLCLGELDEDEYLCVSFKHANYFVQFAGRGKFGMRAEAACNSYIIPPEAVLTVEDYERMTTLGWNRATDPPPELAIEPLTPDGSPNFFVQAPAPVDFPALARLATRTLREAYRVSHPRHLEYKAFARDGSQIRFPMLRLKRRLRE